MPPTSPMPGLPSSPQNDARVSVALRIMFVVGLLSLGAHTVQAIPLSQYQKEIRQAITALDTLTLREETEDVAAYEQRSLETVKAVQNLIPETLTIEWRSEKFNVDNSWLHHELNKYSTVMKAERPELLLRVTERLQALDQRFTELQKPSATNPDKAETSRKLAEILRRPEFAHEVAKENALVRLLKRFLEWLRSLLPKPKPISMGGVTWLSRIAQVVVILLALAVLAYVVKLFLPRLLRDRSPKKRSKQKARIVLGEKLEPDQSASDLLSAAEALARRGELRAAIRKAYIALLVELGERKIISLAQYKTNRDYLRAVREVQPLYGDVKKLTESFERHWYGLAHATESDWLAFRAAYVQALSR
jgi:uncharacterized protein DUF4129